MINYLLNSSAPSAARAVPKLCPSTTAAHNLARLANMSSLSSSSTPASSSVSSLNGQAAMMTPWSITEEVGGDDNVEKLKKVQRDFRTDTITIPSDAMLLAGIKASRGDDVYHEDPSTKALEARVAHMTGKEDAMFVVSGTMSNQLALRTWLKQPPHSVLCDTRGHVHKYESGGIAFFSQAATTTLTPANAHHLTLEDDVEPNLILGDDIHCAPTKIISLENTLNGTIFPQDEIIKIAARAREEGLIMHLDGARIWNVAAAASQSNHGSASIDHLPETLSNLCEPFDSVSLCMSKGLGAPIGSVLVGPSAFIKKAKHFRKLFGGGIRQSGALAASASFALTHNYPLLPQTHVLAKSLADRLRDIGAKILVDAETSMVFYDLSPLNIPLPTLAARAMDLPNPITLGGPRLVVHHQVTPKAVDDLLALISEMKEEELAKGWEIPQELEGVDDRHKAIRQAGRGMYTSMKAGVGSK